MRVCASEGDLSAQGMALTSGEKPRAAQSVGRVDCSVSLGRQASHGSSGCTRALGICTKIAREITPPSSRDEARRRTRILNH